MKIKKLEQALKRRIALRIFARVMKKRFPEKKELIEEIVKKLKTGE